MGSSARDWIWHQDRRFIVTASSLGDKGRVCRATRSVRQPVSVLDASPVAWLGRVCE